LYFLVDFFQPLADIVIAFQKLAASVTRETKQNIVFARLSFLSRVVKNSLTSDRANTLFLIRGRRHAREGRAGYQRSRRGSAGAKSGGVDNVDRSVRTIGDIDRALHLPVEHCGCDEALRKQHDGLLAG